MLASFEALLVTEKDLVNGVATSLIAAVITATALRVSRQVFGWFDFVRSPLPDDALGFGSGIKEVDALWRDENFKGFLWIRLRNNGAKPIYIVRAVYFQNGWWARLLGYPKIDVYTNARHSQKYRSGYEAKFGPTNTSIDVFVRPGDDEETGIPLNYYSEKNVAEVGKRGKLLLEYVSGGRTGVHVLKL